jgi:hypothetical protein
LLFSFSPSPPVLKFLHHNFSSSHFPCKSRDSVVGIVTGLATGAVGILSSPQRPDRL